MEKKIIIFCSTTTLALIAIVGLMVLFNAAFSPKAAMASGSTICYRSADFQQMQNGRSASVRADVQPVPEPATVCMLGFGGIALASQRRQHKNRKYKSEVNLNSKL